MGGDNGIGEETFGEIEAVKRLGNPSLVPAEGRSEPDGASSETIDNEGLVHVDLELNVVVLAI